MAKNSRSIAVPSEEYASVSIRKIDNGFIVSKSHSGPKGYRCTETFSPTKPKIELPGGAPAAKAKAQSPLVRAASAGKKR